MSRPLIVIAGPTGSGKSELGLQLAEQLDGEIIGCDSVQVYKRFDIGSAKLPFAQRRGIAHHLIDICEPAEVFTAGQYAVLARAAIADISDRGRLPIVVGGTGLYLRALLEGLFEGPTRDEALRARLLDRERRRPGSLHRLLRRIDRLSAQRIHANDVQKTIRALEVSLSAGQPMSKQFAQGRGALSGFAVCSIGLSPPRAELRTRIDQRVERMFDCGLIEEVAAILAAGVSPSVKPFESLGYRQALAHAQGRLRQDEARESTQIATRQYAKRQETWFRRDSAIRWLRGFGDALEIQQSALTVARDALASR